MDKIIYGIELPNELAITPIMRGPKAHPIPKVASYAPINAPTFSFAFLIMISNVSGK